MASVQTGPPDVNIETYPYGIVQHLLDQTADINAYAIPRKSDEKLSLGPDHPEDFFNLNAGYGLAIRCDLHEADMQFQPSDDSLRAVNRIGRAAGSMTFTLLFGAGDFKWAPSGEPPCAIFDPWRRQRFTMQNGVIRLGHEDWFEGYGTGRTYPVTVEGRPMVLVTAVGNLMKGYGRFRGLEGGYTLNGRLTDKLGFAGNVTIRAVDPEARIRSDRDLSSVTAEADPDPEASYFVMHLAKKDSTVRTEYGPPPGGGLVSLLTPSQIRTVEHGFTWSSGGLRTQMRLGQAVGHMEADVAFDLLAPPGTAQRPIPFSTRELYTFTDRDGNVIGTVSAAAEEGWAFALAFPAAPGQQGVRFAGVGPITGGTGVFEGAQGLLTVNSVIGIAPHALSLMHVMQIRDPHGRFRR